MKAVCAGILMGAATFLAMNAEELTADDQRMDTAEPVMFEPLPPDTSSGLSELSSVYVLAPQRVVWNENGTALYVQGLDNISLLDADQGGMKLLIDVPANEMVLDMSRNGIVAVLRDFESVVLRDAHGGPERTLVEGANVSSASFSPDGHTLALVLDDGSVLQTWDVAASQMTSEYTSPSLAEQAYSVTFAPSGESLTWYSVMGGQALDLDTGDLGPFVAFSTAIYDVQMCSEDALVVASAGTTLTLWDTSTATIVHAEDLEVYSNSCSIEGDTLAVTEEANVGLLDLPSLSAIEWVPVEAVDAELTPSGDRIAIVGVDGTISVWERD